MTDKSGAMAAVLAPLVDRLSYFHAIRVPIILEDLQKQRYPNGCERHGPVRRRWCKKCFVQARVDYATLRQRMWDLCNDADVLMYEAGITIDRHDNPPPPPTTVKPPPGVTLDEISIRCDTMLAMISLRNATEPEGGGGSALLEEMVQWIEWAYFGRDVPPGERTVDPWVEPLETIIGLIAASFPWRPLTEALPNNTLRNTFAGVIDRINARVIAKHSDSAVIDVDRWWQDA